VGAAERAAVDEVAADATTAAAMLSARDATVSEDETIAKSAARTVDPSRSTRLLAARAAPIVTDASVETGDMEAPGSSAIKRTAIEIFTNDFPSEVIPVPMLNSENEGLKLANTFNPK